MQKRFNSSGRSWAGLALLIAGCSATNKIDYGKVDLVSVSGNVLLDGNPLQPP